MVLRLGRAVCREQEDNWSPMNTNIVLHQSCRYGAFGLHIQLAPSCSYMSVCQKGSCSEYTKKVKWCLFVKFCLRLRINYKLNPPPTIIVPSYSLDFVYEIPSRDGFLPGIHSTLPRKGLKLDHPVSIRGFAASAVEEDHDGQHVRLRNLERSPMFSEVRSPH